MAFRRSNNFRQQRTNSSSRFRRPRATGNSRKTRPTQIYEWSEFHTDNEDILPDSPGVTTLIFTQLATTSTLGDPGTPDGRALGAALRHLDIGGLVFDYEVSVANGPEEDALASLIEGKMYCMVGLVVDRLDGSGQPASVGSWDPFDNSIPVTDPGSISPVRDFLRPQRLLWQRTICWDYLTRTFSGEALNVPNDQRVAIRNPTVNKRLRLRLEDDLGLYFIRAYRPSSAFGIGFIPLSDFWIRGSIYYRYAF